LQAIADQLANASVAASVAAAAATAAAAGSAPSLDALRADADRANAALMKGKEAARLAAVEASRLTAANAFNAVGAPGSSFTNPFAEGLADAAAASSVPLGFPPPPGGPASTETLDHQNRVQDFYYLACSKASSILDTEVRSINESFDAVPQKAPADYARRDELLRECRQRFAVDQAQRQLILETRGPQQLDTAPAVDYGFSTQTNPFAPVNDFGGALWPSSSSSSLSTGRPAPQGWGREFGPSFPSPSGLGGRGYQQPAFQALPYASQVPLSGGAYAQPPEPISQTLGFILAFTDQFGLREKMPDTALGAMSSSSLYKQLRRTTKAGCI
jgi:hypothetical protein